MNNRLPPLYQKVFETYAGSVARGVSKRGSDVDLVAVYVPDYEQLYPYKVPGFGRQPDRFRVIQVPDLSVRFKEVGNITVDVQALDVVHFFNMLLKASPNHVEYLFFENDARTMTAAGEVMLAHRDLFVTQELVTKLVAAGCSLMNKGEPTLKKYMLAVRFFAYAVQATEKYTLYPLKLKGMQQRTEKSCAELGDLSYAKRLAVVFKDYAMEAEAKVTWLPPKVDEEVANRVLHDVCNAHWAELSNG
jgi:hypothetical protein